MNKKRGENIGKPHVYRMNALVDPFYPKAEPGTTSHFLILAKLNEPSRALGFLRIRYPGRRTEDCGETSGRGIPPGNSGQTQGCVCEHSSNTERRTGYKSDPRPAAKISSLGASSKEHSITTSSSCGSVISKDQVIRLRYFKFSTMAKFSVLILALGLVASVAGLVSVFE
jgi:hypothetical protein